MNAGTPKARGELARDQKTSGARKGRVLVVDDEEVIGRIVRRALGSEHDVTALTDAREALSLLRAGDRFDVILCDLSMPNMTGIDFHEELTRLAPDVARDVVFLTGGAFTPSTRAFLDEAPNARLEKPLDLQTLRVLVSERLR